MPKPYHTPKSDRDEEIGALTEAEQIFELTNKLADAEARLDTIGYISKAALAANPTDLEMIWARVNLVAKRIILC